MGNDDEFEFELDDEEEKEEDRPKGPRPKHRSSAGPSPEKKGRSKEPKGKKAPIKAPHGEVRSKEKTNERSKAPPKKAKKMPLADGIKRRLALNKREIDRLRREISEVKDDKEAFESELESLESEFERLKGEKDRLEEEINHKVAVANALEKKQKRTQKDFENFKNRTNLEIERKAKMSQKKLLIGLIESVDNMDRAFTETEKLSLTNEGRLIMAGLESVRKTLLKTLNDQGVSAVDPLYEQFDPHVHEAVDTMTDRSRNENTVISVEAKGYILGEMVLRPAKVKVSLGGKPWPKDETRTAKGKTGDQREEDEGDKESEGKEPRGSRAKGMDELDEVEDDELEEVMDGGEDGVEGKEKE